MRRRAGRSRALLLSVLLLAGACSGDDGGSAAPTLHDYGLMTREGLPGLDAPAYVDSAVLRVLWRELESRAGRLRRAGLGRDRPARSNDGRRLTLRLRVLAGRESPAWLKGEGVSGEGLDCSKGGIAVVLGSQPNQNGCVPRFWEPSFLDRYDALMQEIDRRYGDEPRLAAVVSSACMTIFAEPLFRAQGNRGSNQRLLEAGLTFPADLACQRKALEIHADRLPDKRVALAVNAWDRLVPLSEDTDDRVDGRLVSWADAYELATWARATLGDRLELQNNGLGETDGCPDGQRPSTNVYCFLGEDPGPKGFQTETWRNLNSSPDDLVRTIETAVSLGACYVELPDGYREADELLAPFDRQLEAACDD